MSIDVVVTRINKSIHTLFNCDSEQRRFPNVCLICDRFINPGNVWYISISELKERKNLLLPNPTFNLDAQILSQYSLSHSPNVSIEDHNLLTSCLLSPRSQYVKHRDRRRKSGYTICLDCNACITKMHIPLQSVANNYAFGETPKCLRDLSQVELAMITPVKTFGYCFTYTGGKQKQLKGSLSYYKVRPESIVQTAAHFEGLCLNNHIVIILYGKLTSKQKALAEKNYTINTSKIIRAIKWLLQHNKYWKPFRNYYKHIVASIQRPTVINNSYLEDSSNNSHNPTNIEETQSFQVFYPDGTVSVMTGGQENVEEFQEVLQEATKEGYAIACRMTIFSEAVKDYKDNNLVQACLIQFPYGVGGLTEARYGSGEAMDTEINILNYTTYLSMQSLPQFHYELFTLQLYNMQLKFVMMKSAYWKVRDKHFAEFLGSQLTIEDVDVAIDNKRAGRLFECSRGSSFLGAIDAICKTIPHTNEAAGVARREMESMQHHFGCPTFFLTVTPDDDNHILIQILSQNNISGNANADEMTDEEIFNLTNLKTELRIQVPGICAYFFELVLDIVLKDVIGWDREHNCAVKHNTGVFGIIEALSVTVEEQGRRTLHAHILLWQKELNELRNTMFTGRGRTKTNATKAIIKKIDNLSTTDFFEYNVETPGENHPFPHCCRHNESGQTSYPTVVSKQELRQLRCKRRFDVAFAYCSDCSTTWSQTELMCAYLQHGIRVPGSGPDYSANMRRLKQKTTEFQLHAPTNAIATPSMVDGAYNHHLHTPSCFKHKFDNNTNSAIADECRFRYPKPEQLTTSIEDVTMDNQPWYLWNGSKTERKVKEVSVRRTGLNMFQNTSCPQISYSKLTCNTNISFLLPGPIAQYCVSYTMKNTQKEETKEYELVRAATEKILSKVKHDDSTNSVALRRLIATTFAHQSNNVVGAPMASYLTRNRSRFYFSHSFCWCPLRDIKKLLEGEAVNVSVKFNQHSAYFQSLAMNYLCRPQSLQNTSVFDFYSKYDVQNITNNNKGSVIPFRNTRYFRHPSYNSKKRTFRQGVKEKQQTKLPKVYQYDFPDTATFDGDILSVDNTITPTMEEYCQNVLILFYPFRSKLDLLENGSYTVKFRRLVRNKHFGKHVFKFLQNLQDCKSNNLRHTLVGDKLQRTTDAPVKTLESNNINIARDESNHDDDFVHLNDLCEEDDDDDLGDFLGGTGNDQGTQRNIPNSYCSAAIRSSGRLNCGFSGLPNFGTENFAIETNFVTNVTPITATNDISVVSKRNPPTVEQIVQLLFLHSGVQQRSFFEITGQRELLTVHEPNGSAKSIINWATASNFDCYQKRAFEIMISCFVLSYYDASMVHSDAGSTYQAERRKLRILAHDNKWISNQLICFLHGPGGSGKTAVVNLVLLYAKTFCKYLWSDFQSSERIIVVTALTGVAATLLEGETTHSAVYLNQQRDITREQIELWKHTKMIIIDEVSFADKRDIAMIHSKLSKLKQEPYKRYGGINVVFCGDFRQLEPVGAGKRPLYADNVPEFRDWVNCYLELQGMWRFQNDLRWGRLLRRMRNGKVTRKDILTINEHIQKRKTVPTTIRYACFFNKDRDSINTGFFEERLRACYNSTGSSNGFILVFSDDIYLQDDCKLFKRINKPQLFWEHYGEDDLHVAQGQGRMDPVLRLYIGCRVMLPTNINVADGLANGTQGTVHQIALKRGEIMSATTINGIRVAAVFATQVECITVLHSNDRRANTTFTVKPKKYSFKVNNRKMKATQIPLLLNNATTGHKLQGTGVDELFVHNWSYVTNWVYVMLSRVRTMEGLYARKLLSTDVSKYSLKPAFKRMVRTFRERTPSTLSPAKYKKLSQ